MNSEKDCGLGVLNVYLFINLGFCYPRETLVAYARLCEEENMHL